MSWDVCSGCRKGHGTLNPMQGLPREEAKEKLSREEKKRGRERDSREADWTPGEQEKHDHEKEDPPPTDRQKEGPLHGLPAMKGHLDLPHSREVSGTSWQPECERFSDDEIMKQ